MDNKCYMWPQANNETPMVGRKVLYRSIGGFSPVKLGELILMRPIYANQCDCVYVRESDLREYIGGRGT